MNIQEKLDSLAKIAREKVNKLDPIELGYK